MLGALPSSCTNNDRPVYAPAIGAADLEGAWARRDGGGEEAGGEEEGRVASCHRECTWNVVGVLWVVRV
jgi:hypothetical protein